MAVPKLGKSVYLGMAIMLLSAPLLACTLPGLTLSEEEQECCRHMADMCGTTQMDASHSCCIKTPALAGASLQPTVKFTSPSAAMVFDIPPQPALPQLARGSGSPDFIAGTMSKAPPGHTSVLRI